MRIQILSDLHIEFEGNIVTEMTKYRLYLKLKVGKLLDSKENSVTALAGDRTVTIQSESPPQPISEAPWLVMESGGFETVNQARVFGEELQRAAHLAGLCSRVGVDAGDPGDDREKSWVNPEFLHSVPSGNPDSRVGPDVHGIVILPDDGNTIFIRARANLSVRSNTGHFVRALEESLPGSNTPRSGSPSIRRAIRLLNLAEINEDPIAKMVLAVSTVEGLAIDPSWTVEQQELIDAAAAWVEETHGNLEEAGQVITAIRGVRRESIRQRIKKLLQANNLSSLGQEWENLYEKRSQLFHGRAKAGEEHQGSHLEESELHGLGQNALKVCAQIVLSIAKREGIAVPHRAGVHFGVE